MKKNYLLYIVTILPLLVIHHGFTANVKTLITNTANHSSPNNNIKNIEGPVAEIEAANKLIPVTPVRFLENMGQMMDLNHNPVPFVLFRASAPGLDLYVTEQGLTYVFKKRIKENKLKEDENLHWELTGAKPDNKKTSEISLINMALAGAIIKKENILKEGKSKEHFNFFFPHCPDGLYEVKEYEKITIREIYPGIDWVLYGSSKTGMKYDFIVHPGANPEQIRLIYESENLATIDPAGNLIINTPLGNLTEEAPFSYFRENKEVVKSNFQLSTIDKHHAEVTFKFSEKGDLNNSTLVIDPQLIWATLYGGNGYEGPISMSIDSKDNIIIAGYSESLNFPLLIHPGAYNQSVLIGESSWIMRLSNAGAIKWVTFYGGSSAPERPRCVSFDSGDNIYITGFTNSSDFPLQPMAGAYNQSVHGGDYDGYILRFTEAGIRTWATFFGGSDAEEINSHIFDEQGNLYMTGYTKSSDFPTQAMAGAYNQSSYIGGHTDLFVLKFSSTGALSWSTYFGGNGTDWGESIAIDKTGNIFLTGITSSTDFPVQNWPGTNHYNQSIYGGGQFDAHIVRFNSGGSLTWATYYGGSSGERGKHVAADKNGNIYFTGLTSSDNFPTQALPGAYNQNTLGGFNDIYIVRFAETGERVWSTYYGGSGFDGLYKFNNDLIEFDKCGNVYVGFNSASTNIYTYSSNSECDYLDTVYNGGGLHGDIFLTKFTGKGEILWATYFGGGMEMISERL